MSICTTLRWNHSWKKEKLPLKSPSWGSCSVFDKQIKSFHKLNSRQSLHKNGIFKTEHFVALDALGNQHGDLGAPLKCTEQGIICAFCGLRGRWRWTLATFEVSAFSRRRVSELRGPAAAYQTLPKDKATLCFFFLFFRGHKDRLLMRLRSPSSDLTLGLLSRVSAHIARDFISLLSFLQLELSSKGFLNLFLVSQDIFKETNCISVEFDLSQLPLFCTLRQKYSYRQNCYLKKNI